MSEFEDRLRAELRRETEAPDEAFAARVADHIARSNSRRRIVLLVASFVAVALVAAMALGAIATLPLLAALFETEWQAKEGQPVWISLLVPVIALAGFAILFAQASRIRR